MKNNENDSTKTIQEIVNKLNSGSEGYPVYPESEDIYNKFKKEKKIDPEDITKTKELVIVRKENVEDFSEAVIINDLDIPGFESEEIEEVAGIEDEENNYLSQEENDHIEPEEDLGY